MNFRIKESKPYTFGDLFYGMRLAKDPNDMIALRWFLKTWLEPEPTDEQLLAMPLTFVKNIAPEIGRRVREASNEYVRQVSTLDSASTQ